MSWERVRLELFDTLLSGYEHRLVFLESLTRLMLRTMDYGLLSHRFGSLPYLRFTLCFWLLFGTYSLRFAFGLVSGYLLVRVCISV
jgi:hypothetical protein